MISVLRRPWVIGLNPIAILVLQTLAFWPVWRWYGLRINDSGEEVWGLAALLGVVWVVWKYARRGISNQTGWGPVIATCVYVVAYPWLPPMLRAVIALTALGLLLPAFGLRRGAAFHAVCFLILSLPMIPSLQFYLGYPLRIVSGEVAARLINLAGFPVVRNGALLSWRDHAVFIDAPCSGINMLWAGILLSLALSVFRRHGPVATMLMAMAGVGAVVVGNIFRTTALFFLETGMVRGPTWAHSAVGVSIFTAAVMVVAWAGGRSPEHHTTPLRQDVP